MDLSLSFLQECFLVWLLICILGEVRDKTLCLWALAHVLRWISHGQVTFSPC